jgi:CO/xanthine dehydrogenase FAD-binding subunit
MAPEFQFLTPATLPEALTWLSAAPGLSPLAGGTNLVVDMRSGRHVPEGVVNINHLTDLKGIQLEGNCLILGSTITIADLLKDARVVQYAPALHQAAAVFANPLIRNRATLGGNLVDASPAADMAPPLLVLNAEVELLSQSGLRIIPLKDFFAGVRKTILQPGELLTRVRFSIPKGASTFYKIGLRKADAISVVSAAVYLECTSQNICQELRIALGSVAPRPIRVEEAETFLKGCLLTPENIQLTGKLAAKATSPISDVRSSAEYRHRMAEVVVSRLLNQLATQKHLEE